MPLFQNTVLKKYINVQDTSLIRSKWELFQKHFHNPVIQENIRNSKEEQYQGEFLIDLFVKVLGYTKNPEPEFNLTTEYKNVKDSKKADGAIIIDNKVRAVIELKGTETTDLSRIETQAFGYKNNQQNCTYVITSNFEKLRFYIDNTVNFIEFHLFELTETEFEILYLCLGYENIAKDLPQTINKESLSQEDEITKQLYKDYSQFKTELHKNLVLLNPKFNALTLFKKSQKLLDRFLFLFFAEDRLLLPPNSVRLVLSDWRDLMEKDVDTTLYKRFQKYFGYLNTGFKGKRYDVFAYNGGLFKPDEVLDEVKIDDELLYKHTLRLSEYDFESEVDVNILGHIFENSLTEIEEVQAELEGVATDKTKSKRKKDGVFYTPKYITKYIVENTVGKLCDEKKTEFDITDENYQPAKQRSRKRLDNLQKYRDWLLKITICDPACGSGAFLSEALEFLITEHRYIDELSAKYNKDALILSDVENSILENNLFGVDINEESVEIAKLSLWLRTAQKNRKLNDLSSNIKCGNSLIDDTEIAGSKAFKWEDEFKSVFADGGFDIIIGNPPYVRPRWQTDEEKDWLLKNYNSIENQFDLYHVFIEKAELIRKDTGIVSFILPNSFLANQNSKKLREFILKNCGIEKIIECGNKIFEDASVEVLIYIFNPNKTTSEFFIFDNEEFTFKNCFNQDLFFHNTNLNFTVTLSEKSLKIHQKIKLNSFPLGSLTKVMGGIKEYQVGKGKPPQKQEDKENRIYNSSFKKDDTFKKEIRGKHISPYHLLWINEYVSYGSWLAEPRNPVFFKGKRLLMRQIPGTKRLYCCFTDKDFIIDQSGYVIKPLNNTEYDLLALEALICSKLIFWYYQNENNEFDKLFPKIKSKEIQNLPIHKTLSSKQTPFIERANKMSLFNKELQSVSEKFHRSISRNFDVEKLTKKLENWHELTFLEFIKEMKKKKVSLSLSQQAEWEEYFLQEQDKVKSIKINIDKLDAEIDALVYSLYGLTEEEIKIFEKS